MTETAYIALGSNLGDRAANLREAIEAIGREPGVRVLRVATPIETRPVGCPPGSTPFLNAAAALSTELEPLALLDVLLRIEQSLGRRRSVRNAPRQIDLDLLLFGDQVITSGRLLLPHPRLHERAFVLRPLEEIAPEVIHPTLGKPIRALLTALGRANACDRTAFSPGTPGED